MFPTSLEHPYVPRGRRRGRNDPNSRDYICPCGKSYLSYPALFTHIKIKHNGRAPGQIIKPKSQNPSKRGRPRQVNFALSKKQVYDSQSDTNDIAANCIDRLCDFVTDFQKPDDDLCRKLKNLYIEDPFYRVYLNYNPQEQEPRYNERQDLYDEYCDNVFCEVIAQVNKRLNEPFHIDAVTVFFMLIAHFIDESSSSQNIEQERNQQEYRYGQYAENDDQNQQNQDYMEEQNEQEEIVQEEEEYQDQDHQQNQLKQQNPQKLPKPQINEEEGPLKAQQANKSSKYIENEYEEGAEANDEAFYKLKQQPIRNIVNYINDFIINYGPKFYETYALKEFVFFKQNNIRIFMELLFNWMSMKKYVGYKVKVNHNYQK